jgi:hypothetical protein
MKYVTAVIMALMLSGVALAESKYTYKVDRFTVVDQVSGDRVSCVNTTVVIRLNPQDSNFDGVGSARADWGCTITGKPDGPDTDPDTGEPPEPAPPRPCDPDKPYAGPAPCQP